MRIPYPSRVSLTDSISILRDSKGTTVTGFTTFIHHNFLSHSQRGLMLECEIVSGGSLRCLLPVAAATAVPRRHQESSPPAAPVPPPAIPPITAPAAAPIPVPRSVLGPWRPPLDPA